MNRADFPTEEDDMRRLGYRSSGPERPISRPSRARLVLVLVLAFILVNGACSVACRVVGAICGG